MDQTLNMRMVNEKLQKRKYMLPVYIWKKAFDRTEWEAMQDVQRVCQEGEKLVNDVKSFYKDAN